MPIAFRHRDAPLPSLSALPGFDVRMETDTAVMARLQRRTEADIQARFEAGHRAYVATLEGEPAAWGWVATYVAAIGELNASFSCAANERYLWNFVTLLAFRARGIYPRLIDAIVRAESIDAECFWIAYAPENHASGAGIRKAGFEIVAELSFDRDGLPAVKDIRAGGASAASRLLGLPVIDDAVAQCWKCAHGKEGKESSCAPGACSCDYQHPEVQCAA